MCLSNNPGCKVYDLSEGFPHGCAAATMLQVLATSGAANETAAKSLGRATIASILNAVLHGQDYPLSVKQVIDMYRAVCNGGTYNVNATTRWTAAQVQSYFASLYT